MGPQTLSLVVKETKEGKQMTEMSMAGMFLQKVVYDGEKGYMEIQGQKQQLTGDQLEHYEKASLFAELEVPADAEISGIETVNGEEAYVVKLSDDQSVYYSVESGFKIQTIDQTPMGEIERAHVGTPVTW